MSLEHLEKSRDLGMLLTFLFALAISKVPLGHSYFKYFSDKRFFIKIDGARVERKNITVCLFKDFSVPLE